jgi:ATP-binding cassette subfamily F protein 3
MIEIILHNAEKYFGANQVFAKMSFEIQKGEKVGIIGRNGAGKSTLFRLIAGMETIDNGEISIRKDATIGYLEQMPVYPEDFSVLDILKTAFAELLAVQERIKCYEENMSYSEGPDLERILREYGDLQERFERMGGYEMENDLNRVALGLKISHLKDQKFAWLSGGEKTRVSLATMLLKRPEILLLDEPNNHLDTESMEWLEDFLRNYPGTILVISHDRYLLDHVVDKIILLEGKGAKIYLGNYSYYVIEHEKERVLEEEAYSRQQKEVKRVRESIKKLHDWGVRADNEKFHRRAASMEKRLEKMETLKKPNINHALAMNFLDGSRSGRDVIELAGLKKGFSGRSLFVELDFLVRYGERIAILGPNGCGKTTLLRIISGDLGPDEGRVVIGSNVRYGLLEQDVNFSDESITILECYRNQIPSSQEEARSKLARFNFKGDSVFRRLRELSGGERKRLRLCLMMQLNVNLLILDEPTNHLDIDSREALEEALLEFAGTIVCVSHDRYFINRIADRIGYLTCGRIENHWGDYESFRQALVEKSSSESERMKEDRPNTVPVRSRQSVSSVSDNRGNREEELEEEIIKVEQEISKLKRSMALVGTDSIELQRLYEIQRQLEARRDELLDEWVKHGK